LGPTLWLDGKDASSFTLDGADVVEWRDLSGGVRHFGQTNATKRPTRDPVTGLVTFDRTAGDHLKAAGPITGYIPGYYVSMVGALDVTIGAGTFRSIWFPDDAGGYKVQFGNTNVLYVDHAAAGWALYSAAPTPALVHHECGWSTTARYRHSGGAWATPALAAALAGAGVNPAAIGARHNGSEQTGMSLVHMLVLHGRFPSAAELLAYRNYVTARYGV
jgi:hypothetical protein